MRLTLMDRDDISAPVLLVLGLAGLAGYLLLLFGQWQCLSAPSHVEARDTMYAGVVCMAAGAAVAAGSLFAGGGYNGMALLRGWAGLERLDFSAMGGLMQIAGAALLLLSFFCFNYFLRSVTGHEGGWCADPFLLFLALLLGCSIGAGLHLQQLPWKMETLLALAGGWVACLLWHVHRIDQARRFILDVLSCTRQDMSSRLLLTPHGIPPALSGVRRVLRAMKK